MDSANINQELLNALYYKLNNLIKTNDIYLIETNSINLILNNNQIYCLSFDYINQNNNNIIQLKIIEIQQYIQNIILSLNNIHINNLNDINIEIIDNGIRVKIYYSIYNNITLKLNNDILFKLFTYMNSSDIYNLTKVNKNIHLLCSCDEIWKSIITYKFPLVDIKKLEKYKEDYIKDEEKKYVYERIFYYLINMRMNKIMKDYESTIDYKDITEYPCDELYNFIEYWDSIIPINYTSSIFIKLLLSYKDIYMNKVKKDLKTTFKKKLLYIYASFGPDKKLNNYLNNIKDITCSTLNTAFGLSIKHNNIDTMKLMLEHPKSRYFIDINYNTKNKGEYECMPTYVNFCAHRSYNNLLKILIENPRVDPSVNNNNILRSQIELIDEIFCKYIKYEKFPYKKELKTLMISMYQNDNDDEQKIRLKELKSLKYKFTREQNKIKQNGIIINILIDQSDIKQLISFIETIIILLSHERVYNSITKKIKKTLIYIMNLYIVNKLEKDKAQNVKTWLETSNFLY